MRVCVRCSRGFATHANQKRCLAIRRLFEAISRHGAEVPVDVHSQIPTVVGTDHTVPRVQLERVLREELPGL